MAEKKELLHPNCGILIKGCHRFVIILLYLLIHEQETELQFKLENPPEKPL